MKVAHIQKTQRHAFTLIELLIVIVIIALLIGLLSSAVFKALAKGKETRNTAEIRQLEVAIGDFQNKFNVPYIPSRIKICERLSYYGGTQLDLDSVEYLQRLFPRLDQASWNVGIDWNGNGVIDAAATGGSVILEGDQCLVFFLGGIPGRTPGVAASVQGFSTNPSNPGAASQSRIGPFFDFQAGRLVAFAHTLNNSLAYYSYLDTYGIGDGFGTLVKGAPYAYYSSYKTTNGYNRYGLPFVDCQTLGVAPYFQSPNKYLNPDKYQIISAGPDSSFGAGFLRAPGTAYANGTAGFDDQSNFSDRPLGVP